MIIILIILPPRWPDSQDQIVATSVTPVVVDIQSFRLAMKTRIAMITILFCGGTKSVLKTTFIQVPMSSAVKSFTMSMDRGFLGGAQNTNNNNNNNYKNNLGLTYQLNRMCP